VRDSLVTTFAAPDAVIADWRLPGAENGLSVAQMVRQKFDRKLPAILITGDTRDDVRRLALEHRVLLLYKPVRPAALRAALAAQWQTERIASDALL
jgi:two-component system, sensor histidine kinase